MKIVVNKCFGGFGISEKAMVYLVQKNSPLVRKMTYSKYAGDENKTSLLQAEGYEVERWHEVSEGYFGTIYGNLYDSKGENVWVDDCRDDENRSHPDLVEVVEKLGSEANGQFAQLEVIEIPDGINWEIDEYDGIESVHEVHRSW